MCIGSGRGRGSERGRGGYRGSTRGSRGGYVARGGHQTSVGRTNGGLSGSNNVWDNSQAKTASAKEWTNATVQLMDDTPEETDWVLFINFFHLLD